MNIKSLLIASAAALACVIGLSSTSSAAEKSPASCSAPVVLHQPLSAYGLDQCDALTNLAPEAIALSNEVGIGPQLAALPVDTTIDKIALGTEVGLSPQLAALPDETLIIQPNGDEIGFTPQLALNKKPIPPSNYPVGLKKPYIPAPATAAALLPEWYDVYEIGSTSGDGMKAPCPNDGYGCFPRKLASLEGVGGAQRPIVKLPQGGLV